ncbi:hypothetical protein K3163_05550 [Qipengyuania sp. 1NDW9]|uniref:hypothetical protein n=1 Tax=Qipengyuania xiapuensis TaxID=2867236 RepID=UPI001C88A68F|nr:hypothetical protein [Qipengyuania xiapuensis]MBX7492667.1 hypothetical protein [Qipengyuania xiapuensis]
MIARKIIAAACVVSLAACNSHGAVEEYVANQTRDPASVQFRNVSTCPNDPDIVQGEYNAKNGFGAYVGFKPFMARKSAVNSDDVLSASVGNGWDYLDLSRHVDLAADCNGQNVVEAFRSVRWEYSDEAVDLYEGTLVTE